MAEIDVSGSTLGTQLATLLGAPDMEPGQEPTYQICKVIYLYHPLGAKMAEAPVAMAQSQKRTISVPGSPGERCVEAFNKEWRRLGADRIIKNVKSQSRVYGITSLAVLCEGEALNSALQIESIAKKKLAFNVLDPLNTAGSLVLNQDPSVMAFQKATGVTINGQTVHPSRTLVVMHEDPIYIAYTTSAFGYVGRSVYQRALFPLKSYVQTLVTDDLITKKAGVFIVALKAVGSIIDNLMKSMAGIKRAFVKQAVNGTVITIDVDERIETLNMQNIDGAYGMARSNILKNIATAADMPAKLLENETMVSGFGEGEQDAKNIAKYIDRLREEMQPLYDFFDVIVMRRAWTEEFFKTMQAEYKEQYGGKRYEDALYEWMNSFHAEWPNLLTEPESERIKVAETKYKAVIELVALLEPVLDPANKMILLQWACDQFNQAKEIFNSELVLDWDKFEKHAEEAQEQAEEAGQPGEEDPAAAETASEEKDLKVAKAA